MSLQAVNSGIAAISRGDDRKMEMGIMTKAYSNWETFLTPAPMSIAVLGQLMLVASGDDFDLPWTEVSKKGYPVSFRTCLVRLSNQGWQAFNEAHTSMTEIETRSYNIPQDVKHAVKVLVEASPEGLKEVLPKILRNIATTAERCKELAAGTEKKFVDVMNATGDILEVCTFAKGHHDQKIKETTLILNAKKWQKESAETQQKLAKEVFDTAKKGFEESKEGFQKAVDSLPGGWELLGLSVTESLANTFTSGLSAATNGFLMRNGMGSPSMFAPPANQQASGTTGAATQGSDGATINPIDPAYLKASAIDNHATNLESLLDSGEVDWTKVKDMGKGAAFLKTMLQVLLGEIGTSAAGKKAKDLCDRAITIAGELDSLTKSLNPDKDKIKQLSKDANKLRVDCASFATEAQIITNAPPTTGRPTSVVQAPAPASNQANESIAQAAVKNAQFKIEQTKEVLKQSRNDYDSAVTRLQDSNQKLGDLLAEMAKLDLQKIDFEKIRETLGRGLLALGELREHWGRLVMFFQMVSSIIQASLDVALKNFTEFVETGRSQLLKSIAGVTLEKYLRDLIISCAVECGKIAYVVNLLSSTYVEVSTKHLMGRLAGLGKLMALDPVKDAAEIAAMKQSLTEECESAQQEIARLVKKNKEEFDAAVNERLLKLETTFEALPAPPVEIQKAIQQGKEVAVATKETAAANARQEFDLGSIF